MFKARRKVRPRRRFDHVTLSPPEYLTLETDGVWPPVSEPASVATQSLVKCLEVRRRALRTAAIAAMCVLVLIGWAIVVM
jgi:hypothetical protein